ncbi:hypothetical protein JOM56_010603 [Amanita muscaria]
MPLDGHSFLVSQGWAGKGSGLREGAISRPVAITQKRTLAGVGKDRDEAFPFWDHLFSAAAKSIQLKIHNSDSEDETANDNLDEENPTPAFSRTSTGILSNRRPVTGRSAETSGASTPIEAETSRPKYSLLVTAKREAAKRNLYSRFFRGPVLGPDIGQEPEGVNSEPEGESQCRNGSQAKKKKKKALKVEEEKVRKRKKGRRKSEEEANWDEKVVELSGKGEAKVSAKLPEKTVDNDEEERRRLKRKRKEEKKRARGLASKED